MPVRNVDEINVIMEMLHGFGSVISGTGERLCSQGFELLILALMWGDCHQQQIFAQ